MTKKIWIVSEIFYPEETSTGFIVTKIAEQLAQTNEVNVICGHPNYDERGTTVQKHEIYEGIEIWRCFATNLNKDVILFRIINLLTISISIFLFAAWKLRKNDHVLVVTNPPLLPFTLSIACLLRSANYLLLIHDIYPDLPIASGVLDADSFISRLLKTLNRRLYRGATRIIVLGRDMKRLVDAQLSSSQRKVMIIPNWADLTVVNPQPRCENLLRQELSLSDKFVLQYAGNMGYPNDIESIASAAKLLSDEDKLHFMFIGTGAKKVWLEEQINEDGLENVTLLPRRPRNDQTNFLNACDVALISLVSGMTGVSVPSRTYNTLASGTPIIAIADADSEVGLIIAEEGIGWVVPPNSPEKLAATILLAMADPDRLLEMGCRARQVAENKYSYGHAMQAFSQLVEGLETE